MTRANSPMVPAISAKFWVVCDSCGTESEHKEDSFGVDYHPCPDNWSAFITLKKEPLHFCGECSPALSINGIKLSASAEDVLGEDYFK